jgi:acylphosphatase
MTGAPQSIRVIVVRGRVQRVGFRAWVEHAAAKHDLEGWVRNRRDGSVEALFAGDAAAVDSMIEACRQGPPAAHVEHIDQRAGTPEELAARQRGERFSVLATP